MPTDVLGYRVGQPIPLHDFLALATDVGRFGRDPAGRLVLMASDHPAFHRYPLSVLLAHAHRQLERQAWSVVPEPGVAFDTIRHLRGHLVPDSSLGPRLLEPDLAVFRGRPRLVRGFAHGLPVFAPAGLCLAVELLSPTTARADLGQGDADQVDRWRSYFESDVPELWIINPGFEGVTLPPRSGLFLRRGEAGWVDLVGQGLRPVGDPFRGAQPVGGGVLTSAAVEGLRLDLDAYWDDVQLDG